MQDINMLKIKAKEELNRIMERYFPNIKYRIYDGSETVNGYDEDGIRLAFLDISLKGKVRWENVPFYSYLYKVKEFIRNDFEKVNKYQVNLEITEDIDKRVAEQIVEEYDKLPIGKDGKGNLSDQFLDEVR